MGVEKGKGLAETSQEKNQKFKKLPPLGIIRAQKTPTGGGGGGGKRKKKEKKNSARRWGHEIGLLII